MTLIVPIVKINNNKGSTKNSTVYSDFKSTKTDNPNFRALTLEVSGDRAIKNLNWMGTDFNSAMQRLVAGITALMTQPFFDLYNKKTDEETRKTSCARILGKIIAGTLTGVIIRQVCISATKSFTQNEHTEAELVKKSKKTAEKIIKEFKPWQQCLLPKGELRHADFKRINKYRNAMGTFAAVVIMIFTNFLIDAPLTTHLTNFFVKKINKDEKIPDKKSTEGGNK
ncbi:MAG: hypothetical protein PHC64_02550 [Candidatus Gastranaerophilales bacterium]|nr:hypothetical protein [Candidatus Gastranaerophilales bacterium]